MAIQLSKSKKRTGRAIIGARVAPSTGISLLKPPPQSRFARVAAGPPPWMNAPLSHKVTKVHTVSFLVIPVILRIGAQTGHKQSKAAFFFRPALPISSFFLTAPRAKAISSDPRKAYIY